MAITSTDATERNGFHTCEITDNSPLDAQHNSSVMASVPAGRSTVPVGEGTTPTPAGQPIAEGGEL